MGSILKIYVLFSPQIGAKRIHLVRTRGGNRKYRALRLETGNFSWGAECNVFIETLFYFCRRKTLQQEWCLVKILAKLDILGQTSY